MSLAELNDGQCAVLEGYDASLSAPWRRRFEDLGLLPNTPVRRVSRAPLGDPIAFEVRGTLLCLRRAQARLVRVRRAGFPHSPSESRHAGAPPRQTGFPHSPSESRHAGAPPRQQRP